MKTPATIATPTTEQTTPATIAVVFDESADIFSEGIVA